MVVRLTGLVPIRILDPQVLWWAKNGLPWQSHIINNQIRNANVPRDVRPQMYRWRLTPFRYLQSAPPSAQWILLDMAEDRTYRDFWMASTIGLMIVMMMLRGTFECSRILQSMELGFSCQGGLDKFNEFIYFTGAETLVQLPPLPFEFWRRNQWQSFSHK